MIGLTLGEALGSMIFPIDGPELGTALGTGDPVGTLDTERVKEGA